MFIDFPCIIGLLLGRTVPVYKHVFGLLEAAAARLNLPFEPDHIMSGHEKTLIHFSPLYHAYIFKIPVDF